MSGRLQRELDRLVALVGRGVTVDDAHGRLLAFSARDDAADAARISAILTRKVSPKVLAWEHSHGIEQADGPVHLAANELLGLDARLCVPLRVGAHLVGFLWVLETADPLGPDEIAVLQQSTSVITAALAEVTDPSDSKSRLAHELFLGTPGQQAAACEELISAHPALLNNPVRCHVLAASQQRRDVRPLPQPAYLELERLLQDSDGDALAVIAAQVVSRHAIALCWAHHDVATTRARWRDALSHRVPTPDGVTLTVGLSDSFSLGAEGLAEAHGQALAAAEIAAVDPAMPAELPWGDVGPYRQLVPIASRLPASPHLRLRRLAEQDSGGAMRQTLEAYLDLGGDAGATARALHLHRTSLYYRLDRIGQLLQLDLHDGLTRLDLHLAIKRERLDHR